MNKKVLLTGANGFIGSHLLKLLVESQYSVVATKRAKSDLWRCQDIVDKVKWIDIDGADWKNKCIQQKPDIIIHAAWIGVDAKNRDNWENQSTNIDLLMDILYVASATESKHFIGFGSQAEYGYIDGIVSEDDETKPTTAYGAIKLASSNIIRKFCSDNNIRWHWLRLFSFFGEKESENWLIPSCIKRMQNELEMDFTEGEQRYAYLYIHDLVKAILELIAKDVESAIFNISSSQCITIRQLIETIARRVNPDFKLNFGALPYRSGQSMHIQGNISKFEQLVSPIDSDNFDKKLQKTITYYLEQ